MAHGFACLQCGSVETAHQFRDLYRTCGHYCSPCPATEKWLFAQDAEAERRERQPELRLVREGEC